MPNYTTSLGAVGPDAPRATTGLLARAKNLVIGKTKFGKIARIVGLGIGSAFYASSSDAAEASVNPEIQQNFYVSFCRVLFFKVHVFHFSLMH